MFALYSSRSAFWPRSAPAIGLALGAALPFVVWGSGAILPLPITPAVYARELMLAGPTAALTALAFALWPLGSAHDVPVAALYRERVAPVGGWPRPRYRSRRCWRPVPWSAFVAAAYDQRIALVFAGAAFATFVGLRLLAQGIMAAARRACRARPDRAAPGRRQSAPAGRAHPSVVLSLGSA